MPLPIPRDSGNSAALIERALRWSELFSQWPEGRLAELMKSARLERYNRRTQVLAHDRHRRELLAVVSGCLEISHMSANGRKYVNALLGPGQVAPVVRLLEDVPLAYDYHAHEDSAIVHLPSDAVIAVLDMEPLLWRDVAKLAMRRQRLSVTTLQDQMLGSIRRRIAVALMSLAHLYGAQEEEGLHLRVRLSQNDLATMLGLSRQTINKELGLLAEQQVIDVSIYKRITILDAAGLQRIASES